MTDDIFRLSKGSIRKGFLDILDVKVPAIIFRGKRDGPTVWIQGAIHGDEYTGSMAVLRLAKGLKPDGIRGTIVAIPALNVPALLEKSRVNWVDHKDLNRVFPGSRDGTYSEQFAERVFATVSGSADYFVDLHSGGRDFITVYWSIYQASGRAQRASEAMAEAMLGGAVPSSMPRYVWGHSGKLLEGTLFSRLAGVGIPSVIFESGGGGQTMYKTCGTVEDAVATTFHGLENMLKRIGSLPGRARPSRYRPLGGLVFLSTDFTGLFRPLVDLGDVVKRNQKIGQIEDLHGGVKFVEAPEGGIVVTARTFPEVRVGEKIFELGLHSA